jgi:FMN-dependent oxidoreductase (nitrilotriacetate monooxygenase family)
VSKRFHIGVFDSASLNDFGTVTWRHPDNESYRFTDISYWIELAQRFEDAKLDFLFLADTWGYSLVSGARKDISFTEGLDLPRLDPAIVTGAMAPATRDLGLVITASTLLELPYSMARRLSTLDLISGGRVGWNVVTAGFANTASAVFGREMPSHDSRYDMADDFMELVYKLMEGCWQPDAIPADKGGIYADPARVHRIDHDGPYFSSHGYGNAPSTPQGTPFLFQAGTSGRGQLFGATHGECIFLQGTTPPRVAEYVSSIKQKAAALGRDPESIKSVVGLSMVVAPTREDAQRKYQSYLDLQTPDLAIASYSMFTGIDLSGYDPNTLMDELHTEVGQTQVDRFRGRTIGDVTMEFQRRGVRGFISVGTPDEVADEMCSMAKAANVDGFLLEPWIQPGSTVDFIEHVLPILQKRGLFREEYEEHTLRERMQGLGSSRLRDDHLGARHRPAGQ